MLDVRKLRYFATVADLASITKAATVLRIAQPALSRQIKQLEEELGLPLFVRGSRRIKLTEAGTALLKHARTIEQDFERLLADMRGRKSPKGHVVLGIPPTLADSLVPRLVRRISQVHPLISLKVAEGLTPVLADWLARKEAHLAILSLAGSADAAALPGLLTEDLAAEELVVVDPVGGEKPPHSYDPAALSGKEMVFSELLGEIVLRQVADPDFRLRCAFHIESVQATKAMVLKGQASTILPVSMLKQEIAAGTLYARPISPGPVQRRLIYAQAAFTPLSQAASAIRDLLRQEIMTMREEGVFSLGPVAPELRVAS